MFLPCPRCGFLVALIAPRRGASQRCPRCGFDLPSPDEAPPADEAVQVTAPPVPDATADTAPTTPAIAPLLAVHAVDAEEPARDAVLNAPTLPATEAPPPAETGAATAPTPRLSATLQPPLPAAPAPHAPAPFEPPRAAVPATPAALMPSPASSAQHAAPTPVAPRPNGSSAPDGDIAGRVSTSVADASDSAAPAATPLTLEPYDVTPYVSGATSVPAALLPTGPRVEPSAAQLESPDPADAITSDNAHADGAGDAEAPLAAPEDPTPDVVVDAPAETGAPRRHTPRFARRASNGLRPRGGLLIGIGAALAVLLVLQLALAQRAELAADARFRPAVSTLCSMVGCSLPPWHEPAAFTMLERNVLPSRAAPGRLSVDAHFRNDARWAQAWPVLVLTLSDVEGQPVGTRAFRPAEYLRRGAPPTLAAGASARVNFDVVEPGPGVVAFTFDFR